MGEVLTVTHRDGTTFQLHSKGSTITGVKLAEQSIELNGNDTVTLTVESTTVLPFAIGDIIDVDGKIYTLNQLPQVEKISSRRFSYKATFEGLQYLLLNTAWLMPFSALSYALAGDLATFAAQLVTNLNRVHPDTWEVGTIKSDTATKVLTLSDTNCLDVLQQICEEWEVEFSIAKSGDKYQLSLVNEVGSTISHVFKYGSGGGLYDLQRNGVEDNDFGTRIYFYGGSSNIPNDYFNERQSARLCLAKKIEGNTQTNDPARNQSYIEQPTAIAFFGRIERIKVFEDIYPNRIGSVTAIDSTNRLKFTDSTMFDLNVTDGDGNTLYLIAGTTAKIHFNSGALAGYDFDIAAYDHATHTFTINELQDENNFKFPSEDNAAFRVAVGDNYIITDIVMPDNYVTAAQNELQTAAQDWYEKHSAPAVEYVLTMDEMFLKWLADDLQISEGSTIFHIGDKITVTDTQMNISNKQFRITSLQRDLTKKHSYTLGIADTDERRRRYIWTRRRNRHILPTVIKAGLFDVGHAATAANWNFKNTLNTGRLGILYDDTTKTLRQCAIADDTIIARMIGTGAVLTNKIADDAIVAAKIAANAIEASKILDGAIGTAKLADLAVVAGKIAASAVTAANIAQGAVGTNALAANAVTAGKIATGAVTLAKMDYSATRIFERSTIAIDFDAANKKLTVGAGNYTNELLGEFNIAATTITQPSDGDVEFKTNKEYNVYFNFYENACVATSNELAAADGNILLGRIGTEINNDRTFAPRIFTADPISGSRISGGTLRFVDANGKTKMVKDVDSTAKTLETVVGVTASSGLRKKIADMETEIGDAFTSGSILNDIATIKTAVSGMRTKLDGITYEDCAAHACKTLRLDTLPWDVSGS